MAVRVRDDGLAVVAGDTVGFHAFRQTDGCDVGISVSQVICLPVFVQEQDPLVKGGGLDDVDSCV